MSYLPRSNEPRRLTGDQLISEQVEVMFFEDENAATIQEAINDYLIIMREDPEHVVNIMKVDFNTEVRNNGKVDTQVLIHYRLIGTDDLPYLP